MIHGIESYFLERARFERRLSLMMMALSLTLFSALLLTQIAAVRERLDPLLRRTARFGYEGPDRLVEHIRFQPSNGSSSVMRDVGRVEPRRRAVSPPTLPSAARLPCSPWGWTTRRPCGRSSTKG
jgi:hypothetical protein